LVNKLPLFVKNINKAKETLEHMHDVKNSPTDLNISKNKGQEQVQEQVQEQAQEQVQEQAQEQVLKKARNANYKKNIYLLFQYFILK